MGSEKKRGTDLVCIHMLQGLYLWGRGRHTMQPDTASGEREPYLPDERPAHQDFQNHRGTCSDDLGKLRLRF